MVDFERFRRKLRVRSLIALAVAIGLASTYLALPDDAAERPNATAAADDPERKGAGLEIIDVQPLDPYPGSSITVRYEGARDPADLHVFAGKLELQVLARSEQALVAQLPEDTAPGHLKLRVATTAGASHWLMPPKARPDRSPDTLSKPFHLRVKTFNWRKAFRNLVGGIALVLFGIGLLTRGVRESIGLSLATRLAKLVDRRIFALGLGAFAGAVAHSTTGAAGLLSAFVASRVLPVVPAAIAFLGVQFGAAFTPLIASGLVEPQEGLVAVAIGVACSGLARSRRSRAIARMVLGAGLLALGVQVFRPGLEPLIAHPSLLSWTSHLPSHGIADVALRALLGALLAGILQGPGPLIILMLGVAQTTGRWDLHGALAMLAGTGLGSAVSALVTTPAGERGKQLARLQLALGAASTLFAACTIDVWRAASDWLLTAHPPAIHFGSRIPLPELGLHLAVAFGLSQLAGACLLAFVAPRLARLRSTRGVSARTPEDPETSLASIRSALDQVLERQASALAEIAIIVRTGARASGQAGEQGLLEARQRLEAALHSAVPALADVERGREFGAAAFACMQLQQSLETLLRRAERITDERVAHAIDHPSSADGAESALLEQVHALVCEGLQAARASLAHSGAPLDIDAARAREIHLNRLEAQARSALLRRDRPSARMDSLMSVLQVVDAYEATGNQIYRLVEALEQPDFAL